MEVVVEAYKQTLCQTDVFGRNVDQAEIEMMNSAVIPIPVRLQREIWQQLKEDRFSKT